MKTLRKLNKWMTLQEESNIGLLLFIVVFFSMLCTILAAVAVGYKVESTVFGITVSNHFIVDKTMKAASEPAYALAIAGTVMMGCSWLAIAAGWYFNPTKLDERLSTSITMVFLVLGLIFSIASVGEISHVLKQTINKGYVAGNLIMIIIPTLLSIGLLVDPMIQAFKK